MTGERGKCHPFWHGRPRRTSCAAWVTAHSKWHRRRLAQAKVDAERAARELLLGPPAPILQMSRTRAARRPR